jgi:hypothetical protein
MADYKQEGNRWTMVLVRIKDEGNQTLVKRVPFDIVRFNVDTNPDAAPNIVPLGQPNASSSDTDSDKVYEKIWFVDEVPFRPGAGGGFEIVRGLFG